MRLSRLVLVISGFLLILTACGGGGGGSSSSSSDGSGDGVTVASNCVLGTATIGNCSL